MPDINNGTILRFEDGGTIVINRAGGSEALAVLNYVGGTLRMTPRVRATMAPDLDRGVLRPRIRAGDQQAALLDFDVKYMSDLDATDLHALLTEEGGANDANHLPAFDIVVTTNDGPAGTNGIIHTFTNASRAEAPNISAGAEHDTMIARFVSTGYARTAKA